MIPYNITCKTQLRINWGSSESGREGRKAWIILIRALAHIIWVTSGLSLVVFGELPKASIMIVSKCFNQTLNVFLERKCFVLNCIETIELKILKVKICETK